MAMATAATYSFTRKKEQAVSKAPESVNEPTPGTGTPGSAEQRQAPRIEIDDSKVLALYANFCRVTGTPEELIIDFGLNPQPPGVEVQMVPVTQRIITNFYTAKRMLHALSWAVQRHEATFGVLETDVNRRVRPGAMQPQPGA
jgi:hypothetical protein